MKLNKYAFNDLKWVVINLPHRTDRLSEFRKEMNRIGADFEVFPALNGKDVEGEFKGIGHNIGHWGCLHSHIEVLKQIEKADSRFAYVVCEDDAVFSKDFRRELHARLFYVSFERAVLHYFGANNLLDTKIAPLEERLWRAQNLFTTHCYVVHPSTAGIVRAKLEQRHHYVDCLLVELQNEQTVTCFDKPLVFQRASYSDLLNTNVHHNIKGW